LVLLSPNYLHLSISLNDLHPVQILVLSLCLFITNESFDSRAKSGKQGPACKLDIENVYDHVNWDFLIYIKRSVGFVERWIAWIRHYISSISFCNASYVFPS